MHTFGVKHCLQLRYRGSVCDWFHHGWRFIQSNQYIIILVKCLWEPPLFSMIPFFTHSPACLLKMRVIAERAPAVRSIGLAVGTDFVLGGGGRELGGGCGQSWDGAITLTGFDWESEIGTYSKASYRNPDNNKSPSQPCTWCRRQKTATVNSNFQHAPQAPTGDGPSFFF